MDKKDPQDDKNKKGPKHLSKFTKKKLDSFLSSICEAAGMTGKTAKKKTEAHKEKKLSCQGRCDQAEWRAHMDLPAGVLCVSADWSKNKHAEKHRDVVLSISYFDEKGKPQYSELVFCDSEIRWLMETLWHAPIWD